MNINASDVNSFYSWARLLIEEGGSWSFPEINTDLNFYGSDDSSYLLIEVHQSYTPPRLNQYIICSEAETEEKNNLVLIFDLLKDKNYNLVKLIEWLETSEFIESEEGVFISHRNLRIFRRKYSHQPQQATS